MVNKDEWNIGAEETDDPQGTYVIAVVLHTLVRSLIGGRAANDPVARDFLETLENHASGIANDRPQSSTTLAALVTHYRTMLAGDGGKGGQDH